MAKPMSFKSHHIEVKAALGKAAMRGLTDAALDLTRRAVQDAPIDLGDLRGSGSCRIEGTEVATGDKDGGVTVKGSATAPPNATRLEAQIGFTEPYALIQHEKLDWQHPKGGKAKYLEDAYTQNLGRYEQHIADAIKEGMQ